MRPVATRKTFKAEVEARREEPMAQILSSAQESGGASSGTTAPATRTPRKPRPPVEKRTRRVQITMAPSLFAEASADAEAIGISFNEYVSRAVRGAIDSEWVADEALRGGK